MIDDKPARVEDGEEHVGGRRRPKQPDVDARDL
jgi:hypothetical protein